MSRNKNNFPSKNQQNISVQTVQHSVWNFPIPPPELLDKYKQSHPEVGQMFVDQWRLESEHRRQNEVKLIAQKDKELEIQAADVRSSHRYDLVSLILSFVLIAIFAVGGVFLVTIGQSLGAIASFVAALAFFWKRKLPPVNSKDQ